MGELDKSFIHTMTEYVVHDLSHLCDPEAPECIPTIEDVQDVVERTLVKLNRFEVAKAYILYREKRKEEREEKHEKLIRQFEKKSLKVIKANGSKETFDLKKIKAVFDRSVNGYSEECLFEDFVEAFKKNIVDEIQTRDIAQLLVKTCIDLVTVENIAWQHVASRIFLGNLYKQATKNRGISIKQIYTTKAYKALFDDYVKRELYYKKFYDWSSLSRYTNTARNNEYLCPRRLLLMHERTITNSRVVSRSMLMTICAAYTMHSRTWRRFPSSVAVLVSIWGIYGPEEVRFVASMGLLGVSIHG